MFPLLPARCRHAGHRPARPAARPEPDTSKPTSGLRPHAIRPRASPTAYDRTVPLHLLRDGHEVVRATNGRPDDIVGSIHRSLFAHTQARTRADDQTLVAMQYVGPDRCLFPPVRAGV